MRPTVSWGRACSLPAGASLQRTLWRRWRLLPFLALALLLAPTGVNEVSARPTHVERLWPALGYYTDFTGFPKWRDMLRRFSVELSDPASPDARVWEAFAVSLRAGDRLEELRRVNAAINAFPYVSDEANWGRVDFWETPIEFLHRGGDCEDFAVAKYMALLALGVATDDMRVAVVDDRQLDVTHAVLIVAVDDRYYVLDNLNKDIVPASATPFYRPIYAVNEHGWWSYGSPTAASAAGK